MIVTSNIPDNIIEHILSKYHCSDSDFMDFLIAFLFFANDDYKGVNMLRGWSSTSLGDEK